LEEAEPYFAFVVQGATTHVNEWFNSQQARSASKSYAWQESWTRQMALAVLRFNHLHYYFLNFLENFQLDISDDFRRGLVTVFASAVKEHQHETDAQRSKLKVSSGAKSPHSRILSLIQTLRIFNTHHPIEMTSAVCATSVVVRIQAVVTLLIRQKLMTMS
jgi:hypothetical protein